MSEPSTVTELVRHLHDFLRLNIAPGRPVTVGLSGGVDSMVLLDAVCRLRPVQDLTIQAVHVHHGLSSNADRWAEFCGLQAKSRDVPFRVAHAQVNRGRGTSLEAEARKARMGIFASLDTDAVLLGHHLDDQGETLLLQLLRGAGPRGLSSMGRSTPLRSGVRLMRPWLDVSRRRIVAYARDVALQWVEDESNLDSRFDRNFLRNEVLPTIESRFPGYRINLFRSAQNMADLDEVAHDLGSQDLASITRLRGISAAGLGALSLPRGLNALRCATRRFGVEMPSRDRLVELHRQVTSARYDASVEVNLGGLTGRVYRGHLVLTPNLDEALPWTLKWSGEEQLELPQRLGTIRRRFSIGRGLRADVLEISLQIRNRCGGERLRVHSKQARKTLTHLFQQLGVPPWERVRTPILCSDERVLWVPGVGYDADQCAALDEKGIELEWIRES